MRLFEGSRRADERAGFTPGFTLVELLVVVGIIAVLIAILMPALSRARMSANLVKCQSNLRQVYSAVTFYANESKGMLPRCSGANIGTMGTYEETFIRLSELLGTRFNDPVFDSLNPVFTCVYADTNGSLVWAPNLVRTIKFHPRAFPGYDQLKQMPAEFPQRKMATVRNPADKIMLYEGAQLPGWNMTTEPEALYLDGWRWNWGHMYADPPADGDYSRWGQPIEAGLNRDDDWWICAVRFRHMKNTMTPVAFFDGHVESRRKGEIKVREVCISR